MRTNERHTTRPRTLGLARRTLALREAAGKAPASRRGNFFVLVVGTLALLSVVAVAYVTVGRADRRLSGAVNQTQRVDAVANTVADYLAGVIARDVTSLFDETGWAIPNQADDPDRGETWDAPWTRRDRLSTEPTAAPPAGAATDRFVPWGHGDDPWLASTAAENMGLLNAAPAANEYANFVLDWPQISNFAPDGRFVNLANLRNNFNALPGSGPMGMSQGLTLLDVTDEEQRPTPTTNLAFTGAPADTAFYDVPADWNTFQVGAFRPIVDVDPARMPSDDDYIGNQWADADNDGMADSRWIELVDASDRGGDLRYILPPQDGLRWFVAARAIDLSGLVNVNTATDFQNTPIATIDFLEAPPGATPADVDLSRLLAIDDITRTFADANGGAPLAYDAIPQPTANPGQPGYIASDDYTGYDAVVAPGVGDRAMVGAAGTFKELDGLGFDVDVTGALPGDLPDAGGDAGRMDTPEARANWYYGRAGLLGAGAYNGTDYITGARYSIGDQIELLDNWGANDPNVTTTLESTLATPMALSDGAVSPTPFRLSRPYSPLRSDRSLELERRVDVLTGAGSVGTGGGSPDGVADDEYQNQVLTDIRRLITTHSGARPIASVQPRMAGGDIWRTALSLPDLLDSPDDEDRRLLFDTIYDTLVPFAHDEQAWAGATDFIDFRFRNYGYDSAELGLRLSAHLTANLIDSYDTNNEPTVFTVAISEQGEEDLDNNAAGTFATLGTQWRWARWNDSRTRLNSDEDETNPDPLVVAAGDRPQAPDLAGGMATPQSQYINVYGIEAQPFLTEVAAFYWYADAPWNLNPDEGGTSNGNPWDYQPVFDLANSRWEADWTPYEVTIDGAVDNTNDDYIASFIVFQLHNPFDEPVSLSGGVGGGAFGQYYIEFGGRYYKLSEINWEDLTETSVTIDPGESKNFYIIGERPNDPGAGALNDPEDRLDQLLLPNNTWTSANDTGSPMLNPVIPPEGRIRAWIQNQASITLGGMEDVIAIPEFNPSDGVVNTAPAEPFLLSETEPAQNQVVMLWRTFQDPAGEAPLNDLRNDILADRLRDPQFDGNGGVTPATLDARLAGGGTLDLGLGGPDWSFYVDMVQGQPDEPAGGFWGDGNDPNSTTGANSGASIVTWASIRRPSDVDTAGAAAAPPLGGWPAYLIEPKAIAGTMDPTSITVGQRTTNSGVPYGTIDITDFRAFGAADDGLSETLDELVFDQIEGNTVVHTTIIADADAKPGPIDQNIGPTGPGTGVDYDELRAEVFPREVDAVTAPGDLMMDESVIRVGDLLSTIAIGSWYDPSYQINRATDYSTTGHNVVSIYELESAWTTLPEAMALALGYQTRSSNTAPFVPGVTDDIFANIGGPTQNAPPDTLAKLDRGHLVIDDFVPYVEGDGNFGFIAGDQATGTLGAGGLPTNADLPTGLGIPIALELMDRFRATPSNQAGLRRLTSGLVNINTAPWAVLRTLPLLSPRAENGVGVNEFWDPNGYLRSTETGAALPPGDVSTDIAAAIVAYRNMAPFPLSGVGAVYDNPSLASPMDFSEQQVGFMPEFETPYVLATGIPGLREDNTVANRMSIDAYALGAPRGFRSLGELLCVRYNDGTNDSLHNITKLAENRGLLNNDASTDDLQAVIEGRRYEDGAGVYESDGIDGDYDERLAIFNAVSNIATVRSDVYAVWFVLHGYREGDVSGLAPEDPMTPSIKRRYLMIIDRSNVVDPGDKPKILAFREVGF